MLKVRAGVLFLVCLWIWSCLFSFISLSAYGASVENLDAEIQEEYKKDISVGFSSMGEIRELHFTVTGSYLDKINNSIFKEGKDYKIELLNGVFQIYEDGYLLISIDKSFTLEPSSESNYIQFSKEGAKRNFSGSITFKLAEGGFTIINTLPLEEYVKGVLPFEMSDSFPLEALKAQAVAARTYALAHKGSFKGQGYDVKDDTNSQVYRGAVPSAGNCIKAVEETEGEILTFNGEAINAVFSASNGGFSESAKNVWGWEYPYLKDQKDPYDQYENWTEERSALQIQSALKEKYSALEIKSFAALDLKGETYFPSGRVSGLGIQYLDGKGELKSITLTRLEVRNFFNLKSAFYAIEQKGEKYLFKGSGYGHGVGLSQWGACGRANSGQGYKEILNFYYPNTDIVIAEKNKIVEMDSRIGGQDRYETATLIANSLYLGKIDTIIVASGVDFPDALSGSVLAKKLEAPILLLNTTVEKSTSTLEYIKEHGNPLGKIYILGGTGVISEEFLEFFQKLGYSEDNLIRIGGEDRIETSLLISKQIQVEQNTPVVIASAANFPDALSIAPIAAAKGWPILLVDGKTSLPDFIKELLFKQRPEKIYIVGGEGVISVEIEDAIKKNLGAGGEQVVRLGGTDRYETSEKINIYFLQKPQNIFLASGKTFPDSLSGSVYAATQNAPILLVDTGNTEAAKAYIQFVGQHQDKEEVAKLIVLGLQGAVRDATVLKLTGIMK